MDLRNLDTAFQDQKIKALLAAGYRIATVITATDEGHPIAILIFEPQERPVFALKNDKWVKAGVVLLALNFAVLVAAFTLYLQHP